MNVPIIAIYHSVQQRVISSGALYGQMEIYTKATDSISFITAQRYMEEVEVASFATVRNHIPPKQCQLQRGQQKMIHAESSRTQQINGECLH